MRFVRPVSSRVVWGYAFLLSTAAVVSLIPWVLKAADAPAKSKPTESKATESKTAESKPDGVAAAKSDRVAPKEKTERGRFVSFRDGLLTIQANSGAMLENRVPAGAKGFVWSNAEDKYVPVDAAEALGRAQAGNWFYVHASENNFTFRIGSRKGQTIGTFVSFQDDRLLMLARNLGGSYAKKYGNNVHFHKFRDDTPIYESVDGGEYKQVGTANKTLSTVREGTVLTVYGEGDDNITRVEIGVADKK